MSVPTYNGDLLADAYDDLRVAYSDSTLAPSFADLFGDDLALCEVLWARAYDAAYFVVRDGMPGVLGGKSLMTATAYAVARALIVLDYSVSYGDGTTGDAPAARLASE